MLSLSSPSKINVFLKVVGRRPDGFHDLASLFQTVDLKDTLHLAFTDKDEMTSPCRKVPRDNSNLIFKVADLFRKKSGKQFGLHVHLVKRIPLQAGLGGGSSNAATTLWGLNELFGKPYTVEELIEWSAEIGSDVPFFFTQGTAYCTGRGEILRPIEPLISQKLWIVKPDQGLSTPEVFKNLMIQELPLRDPENTLENILKGKMDCFNDLETSAVRLLPELVQLKQKLGEGHSHVSMTGSGSAFFCLGGPAPHKIPHTKIYPAKFINRPLDAWYV
jgi:4-diphosphocytidyl-2-C-methyl-D-erythritol kinase